MRIIYKSVLYFPLVCCLASTLPSFLTAQDSLCRPSRLEIPRNGFDEDCDGFDDLFLHLPPRIYAVEGQPFELYFRNIILSRHPQDYFFTVKTILPGETGRAKWAFTPAAASIGEHALRVYVRDAAGTILDSASTAVRVSPTKLTEPKPQKLILLGHSFYEQGFLPKYLWDLTQQAGHAPTTFHGRRTSWAEYQARNEGYGGMTWQWFASNNDSPLRHNNRLQLRRYFDQVTGPGQTPDAIVIQLDINDFCGYSTLHNQSLQEIDDTIRAHWDRYARPLIDSVRAAAPLAKIAICYLPPPNALQASFTAAYGDGALSDPWRWKKIVSRVNRGNTDRYAGREQENIWLIPQHLDFNDTTEYSPNDPIHPHPRDGYLYNHCGYNEMARSIYAWLHHTASLSTGPPPLQTFYRDADADGYGNPAVLDSARTAPPGFVPNNLDCDDANRLRYPGAPEIPGNRLDDDCDGTTDETPPPAPVCVPSVKHQLIWIKINDPRFPVTAPVSNLVSLPAGCIAEWEYAFEDTLNFRSAARGIEFTCAEAKLPSPLRLWLRARTAGSVYKITPIMVRMQTEGDVCNNPVQERSDGQASISGLSLSPNPTRETLHLTGNSEGWRTVVVFNTLGAVLRRYDHVADGDALDVQSLPSGLFFLRAEAYDGQVAVKRFEKIFN